MYNKLFSKIVNSSVWLLDDQTRIVWLTMLALMDELGFVQVACVENLAHIARVSLEAAQRAVDVLSAPDQHRPEQENEGRRIEQVDGGWIVLNGPHYRAIATRAEAQQSTRERVRRYRERKRLATTGNGQVTPVTGVTETLRSETVSDTVTETERESRVTLSPVTSSLHPDSDSHVAPTNTHVIALSRRDKQRACLVSLGAIMVKDDVDLLDEWLTVTKGCKEAELRSIFENARPGIQWPSDFRHERESPVR